MATAKAYGPAVLSLLNKEIDWVDDTVKCALATTTYTPDQDTHRYFSSVTNEITGTGYVAGGVTVTGKTATYDTGLNVVTLSCTNPAWTGTTLAYRYAIFYVTTGSAATSPLICYVDFGTTQSTTNQDLTLVVPVTGLLQFTVA